jgi:RimJ/RimL family protein N-acetyltransferase
MEPSIDFRPLTEADLPSLVAWTHAPHAATWFGGGWTRELVEEEYIPAIRGDVPIHAYVVLLEGRPVGMMQWERFGDAPGMARLYGVDDPWAINCDVILGDAGAAHRGLGPLAIRVFLERIAFADPRVTSCVIDPVPDNAIAIRAYEKAGFRFLRAAPEDGEGNALYLLELRRDELAAPPAPPLYVRPARLGELPIASAIDDDAVLAYAEIGLAFSLAPGHPFVAYELGRWRDAAEKFRLLFACLPGGEPAGFAAFGVVDGRPYLQQVSVRRAFMRRGIGRALVERALRWSVREGELTLTTYDARVDWNEPWYARLGFARVPEEEWGPELRDIVAHEREALPAPEARVVMRYRHAR